METHHGYYALIQYSPRPDRMEFVNIGVLLVVPELAYVGVRFSAGSGRVERLFGRVQKPHFDAIKAGFELKLRRIVSQDMRASRFAIFGEKRANDIRVSPPMPISLESADETLDSLFIELVGEDASSHREPRVGKRLEQAFAKAGVVHILDSRPEVELPEYGIRVSTPFGYQNGCYNLVDAMKLPKSTNEGMREAGKRAMEGSLIWKHSSGGGNRKRLVVVGDFREQSSGFFNAVAEQMSQAHVKLYRLDELHPLIEDIKEQAALHP